MTPEQKAAVLRLRAMRAAKTPVAETPAPSAPPAEPKAPPVNVVGESPPPKQPPQVQRQRQSSAAQLIMGAGIGRPLVPPTSARAGQSGTQTTDLIPNQYSTGGFTRTGPLSYESDVAMSRMDEAGLGGATPEEGAKIREEALASAHADVAAITDHSERRGNAVVALDRVKLLADIKAGRTWLGMATGGQITQAGLSLVGATDRSPLAPWYAMGTPGWTSADMVDGEDISSASREGKGWWLLRATALTPAMAYITSEDPDMTWNSDKHLERIQNYDYVSDFHRIGEMAFDLVPDALEPAAEFMASGDIALRAWQQVGAFDLTDADEAKLLETRRSRAEMAVGGALTTALLLADPDPTAVATLGVGAGFRRLTKGGALVRSAVIKPALAAVNEMEAMTKAGKTITEIGEVFTKKYGPNSVQLRVYSTMVQNTVGRLASYGLTKLDPSRLSGLERVIDDAEVAATDAGREAVLSADEARKAAGELRDARTNVANVAADGRKAVQDATDDVHRAASEFARGYTKATARVADAEKALSEALEAQNAASKAGGAPPAPAKPAPPTGQSPLFGQALDLARRNGAISAASVQQEFKIGYVQAQKLVDELAAAGHIGPATGKPRVFIPNAPKAPANALPGADLPTNPDEFLRLVDEAKGVRQRAVTVDRRIDALLKERREMKPPFDMARFGQIDQELKQLGKMKAAIRARQLATAADMSVAALVKGLNEARAGLGAMERLAESRYGLSPDALQKGAAAVRDAMLRDAQASSKIRKAGKEMARGVKQANVKVAKAAAAVNRSEDAMRTAADLQKEVEAQRDAALQTGDFFAEEIKRVRHEAQLWTTMFERGTAEQQQFKFATSAVRAAAKGQGGALDLIVLAEEAKRYGKRGAQRLMDAAENGASIQQLRKLEEELHLASENLRIGNIATLRGVKAQMEAGASPGMMALFRQGGIAQHALRSISTFSRFTNSISEAGLEAAPEAIREVLRKGVHLTGSMVAEVNDVAEAVGMSGVWRYLTTTSPIAVAGRTAVLNSDSPPAVKFLGLLAALAKDEASFKSNEIVKAVAHAWQPSGVRGEETAGIAIDSLYKAVRDGKLEPNGLRKWFDDTGAGIWASAYRRTDSPDVANRFLIKAIVHGAAMFDIIRDYQRATSGLRLDKSIAEAMQFVGDPTSMSAKAAADVFDARKAAAALGNPLLPTIRGIVYGSENQGKLLREVVDGVWMPDRYWKAINSIPEGLAKELKAFHDSDGVFEVSARTARQYLRTWKMSSLFGGAIPRAGMFTKASVGDWSQMVLNVGFATATRLTAQNLVTNIPFVGRIAQDELSKAARYSSVIGALFDPHLAVVLKGGDEIIETGDGPMTASQFMREILADGARDSIGSEALHEITARMKDTNIFKRLASVLVGLENPPWIKAAGSMFEEVQFRQRVGLALDLRVRQGLGRNEARAKLLDTLFDYRAGPTKREMNTIGQVAAFWVYRRNALRMLGGVLTQQMTASNVMFNSTKLHRLKQAGRIQGWVPDLFNWADDEYGLTPEDNYQLGKVVAPWFVDNSFWMGNIPLIEGGSRQGYYEDLGRDVTHEAIVLNGLIFGDMLNQLNMWSQLAGATAAANGLVPGVGAAGSVGHIGPVAFPKDAVMDNVSGFADGLIPPAQKFFKFGTAGALGIDERVRAERAPISDTLAYVRLKGMLATLGMDDVMYERNGKMYVDDSFMGWAYSFCLATPVGASLAQNLAIADNPGMRAGVIMGTIEALIRGSGVVSVHATNPGKQLDDETQQKDRKLKELRSEARKRNR